MNRNIVFLKNKTEPRDKYWEEAERYNYQSITSVNLIEHNNLPNQLLQLLNDTQYLTNLKYIIITSQRTVECLYYNILNTISPEVRQALLSKTVYTVGPMTAEFLVRCGFKNVKGSDTGNGNKLADLIHDELRGDYDDEILFLVGVIRKDTVLKKLTSFGYKVRELVTYETLDLTDNLERFVDSMKTDSINWIVVFSPQGINEILDYLKDSEKSRSCLVASIGPSTTEFLLANGIEPAVTSSKPTCDCILREISEYRI